MRTLIPDHSLLQGVASDPGRTRKVTKVVPYQDISHGINYSKILLTISLLYNPWGAAYAAPTQDRTTAAAERKDCPLMLILLLAHCLLIITHANRSPNCSIAKKKKMKNLRKKVGQVQK